MSAVPKQKAFFRLAIYLLLTFWYATWIGCAAKQLDLVTADRTSNDYPLEFDIAIGTLILEQQKILSGNKIDTEQNKKDLEVLREITHRIAKISHYPQFPYEVHLVDVDINNALCAPGGKIIVYEGLWNPAGGLVEKGNKDQLAAVIAHEIAHANARHGTESLTRREWTKAWVTGITGGITGALGGSNYANLGQMLGTFITIVGETIIPTYSRKDELEADQIGLIYMAKAGFRPSEAIKLWEKAARGDHSDKKSVFATHPPNGERASKLKEQLAHAMLYYEDSMKGTTPATYKLLAHINSDVYQVKNDTCNLRINQMELVDSRSYSIAYKEYINDKIKKTTDAALKSILKKRVVELEMVVNRPNVFYHFNVDNIENPLIAEVQPSGELFLKSALIPPYHVCRGKLPSQARARMEKFYCALNDGGVGIDLTNIKKCSFSVTKQEIN